MNKKIKNSHSENKIVIKIVINKNSQRNSHAFISVVCYINY